MSGTQLSWEDKALRDIHRRMPVGWILPSRWSKLRRLGLIEDDPDNVHAVRLTEAGLKEVSDGSA